MVKLEITNMQVQVTPAETMRMNAFGSYEHRAVTAPPRAKIIIECDVADAAAATALSAMMGGGIGVRGLEAFIKGRGERFVLDADDVTVVPPNQAHQPLVSDKTRRIMTTEVEPMPRADEELSLDTHWLRKSFQPLKQDPDTPIHPDQGTM